jgi:hypothetical protein
MKRCFALLSRRSSLTFSALAIALSMTFVAAPSISSADSLVIAPPSRTTSGCNLAVAGFKTKNQFLVFFQQLQAAVKSNNKDKLSGLVIYPLSLNFGTKQYGQMKRKVKDKKDFMSQFQSFYSKRVQAAILGQKVTNLFCNSQGVMLGRGQVWIAPRGNAVGIITINN